MKRSGLLAVMVAFSWSCTESTSPDRSPAAPVDDAAGARAAPARGIDAEFVRLAGQIPGFAGISRDPAGKVMVHLRRPESGARVGAAALTDRLRSLGSPAVRRQLASAAVTVQDARYDYVQLKGFKDRLSGISRVRGAAFLDIDEAANRVRIGIVPGASKAAVDRVVRSAGVPPGAVIVGRSSPVEQVKTLAGRFRPVPGAVEIVFPLEAFPGFAGVCTLGFNVRLPSRPGENFFVTASHCSEIAGGNDQSRYFQPFTDLVNGANRIAREFKDPPLGNPGGLCFEGFRCRFSDALLARYGSSAQPQFGKIARTTFARPRLGSVEINPQNPRWTIVGEVPFPFEGEIVQKVGSTGGWTFGPVVLTCADTFVSGTDIVRLCQDFVFSGARAGDSGAPVFIRVGGGNVLIAGTLWGGTTVDGLRVYVFSSMENIEFELGQLTTSAGAPIASAQ